jgi:hypothetical protein
VTTADEARAEGLRLAVQLWSHRDSFELDESVTRSALRFAGILAARATTISVGDPVISEQGHPALHSPVKRTGADMAVTITDTQVATYPAASETDSKGFPVTGDTITIAEDSGGTVVAMQQNPDGSAAFPAVAPGSAQVSWTNGTLSFADTINVTPGDAASLVVGAPVITDQAPPAAPTA